MQFSPSTGCFYPAWGQYDNAPADLIEATEEEFEATLNRPLNTRIVVVNGRVAIEPIPLAPLAERQEAVWDAIKAERDKRGSGGIKVGDLWFHSDDKSTGQHLGLTIAAMQALQAGGTTATVLSPTPWKTMSGEKVPLTVGLALAIFQAGVTQAGVVFAAAEIHKTLMEASPDPAAYDFHTGFWPAHYEEVL